MIKVIVADDHPVVRQGILQQLSQVPDIQVINEAKDGPTLSVVLAKFPPDVLLLDISMPDFSAIEAVPLFHEKYPQMKILIVTGHGDEMHVQDMVKCNVDGYMVKDEHPDTYAKAIRDVCAGGGYYSEEIVPKALRQRKVELSAQQKQVLLMIALGDSAREIAKKLGVTEKTVRTHSTRMYKKLGVNNRAAALTRALKLKLIDISELECDDWD